MMPLKYLKDLDCWNPLPKYEAELGGRIGNESGGNEPCRHAGSVMRLDIQQFRRDKCA